MPDTHVVTNQVPPLENYNPATSPVLTEALIREGGEWGLDEVTELGALSGSMQAQRWGELADVLRREIRLANNDGEIIALQFRLGQLYEQNLRDIDSAIGVYDEILKSDGGHAPTQAALELLFAEGVKQIEIAGILEPLYRITKQ